MATGKPPWSEQYQQVDIYQLGERQFSIFFEAYTAVFVWKTDKYFCFQFAAVLHIGRTKAHPPIPEDLSPEAKDFLLKCLHK